MDRIMIRYPNGWMAINVRAYFPCLQKHARMLFALIKNHSSDEDKAELGQYLFHLRGYLRMKVAEYQVSPDEFVKRPVPYCEVPTDFEPGEQKWQSFYELRVLFRRADANYRLFCEMEVDDAWMN